MGRPVADILSDLDAITPPANPLRGWQPFAALVAELERVGGLPAVTPRLLAYFERHPTARVVSWLWDAVHAIERHPGRYEAAVLASLGRRPSDFAARLTGRAARLGRPAAVRQRAAEVLVAALTRSDNPPQVAAVLRQALDAATDQDAEPCAAADPAAGGGSGVGVGERPGR